jgi:CubicO group peptidase (beta-lactamase class C family)
VVEEPKISELLQERIAAGDFPSAVYLVGEKGKARFSGALGRAVVKPRKIGATLDTIYDVASLTKVLVTTLLWAKLIERDKSYLTKPASTAYPHLGNIEDLLTHTAGLPAWHPFYLTPNGDLSDRRAIFKHIAGQARAAKAAKNEKKVVYSDPGFIVLGFLLEGMYKAALDEAAEKEIFAPLGLKNTFFDPSARLKPGIAASERGNVYEKQTCIDMGFPEAKKYAWRKGVIWGEVHDGNAWHLNGVAGHAGLFSNAMEVFQIAQQFLPGSTSLLQKKTCTLFRKDLTPGLNEARSLGFQLATKDSTGKGLAPDSFGHLGFTGTSLWIEPETERIFILLTNRTHDHPLPFVNINSTRREFHRLAVKALNKL